MFLAGCGNSTNNEQKKQTEHTHTYSDKWSSNESGHFHNATCEHSDLFIDFAEHIFIKGKCDICGFVDATYVEDWTNEEKTIFDDHFYGIYLPFIDDASITFDINQNKVVLTKEKLSSDEFNQYIVSLEELEFTKVNGTSENSYILSKNIVVDEVNIKLRIDASYTSGVMTLNCFELPRELWPSTPVNYYTNQLTGGSDTKIPSVDGALKYEFIESAYDSHGYFFVSCESNYNYESSYANKLDENYTVYNEKTNSGGNYWAISDNNDLLVQYKYIVVESTIGNPDYKHFDVLFEKYFPHNDEHLDIGLNMLSPGTTTKLPEYPGYGEKITIPDYDNYMTVMIQAAEFDSVAQYVAILNNANWNVKTINEKAYNYEAISPNRDIKVTTAMYDGRITLTVKGYADPYKTWPTEGVNEILTGLGLSGEIPVFEGALGFDYENTKKYKDVVCFVRTGNELTLIENYHNKLENNGWIKIIIEGATFYVDSTQTIAIYAYSEYVGSGIVFIEFSPVVNE